MSNVVLSVKELVKECGGHVVIQQLTVDVRKKRTILVQGPSGCGKTTLLRCMCFLEKIQGGEIVYDERIILKPGQDPILEAEDRKRISMVFQNLYLWNHMSVIDNISLPLVTTGISPADSQEIAMDMLERLDMSSTSMKSPSSLSGGQMQRVALARALVHSPDLLLLDEITANLDLASINLVFGAVEKILDGGVSIVLVSHSDKVPAFLKDETLIYENGKWQNNK